EVLRAVRALRLKGSVARVHLALRALPRFEGIAPDALAGTLVVASDVASLERAWDDAKRGAPSRRPYIEATLPSVTDPTFAPAGGHVLDAWVQYVPYGKGDRDAVRDAVLASLAPHAPDLAGLVTHANVSLPEDLERAFGLAGGHLYGGEVRLDQAFFLRPFPGAASDATPIDGLALSGSAAHPGGYSGRSGWNLAARLLARRRDEFA
ncbi:MAG TPA: hypothetical protein VHB21_18645, partial [Minicystis sp.]|nr:hypothetical protein [Minicystis sp.]